MYLVFHVTAAPPSLPVSSGMSFLHSVARGSCAEFGENCNEGAQQVLCYQLQWW